MVSQRWPLGFALFLHASLTGFAIWEKSFSLDGRRWFLLEDDAMVSMRYARNFADGNGLVWNLGERVEGFTSPVWTLGMTIPHLLPIPYNQASLFVQIANLALGMLVVLLAYRLALVLSPANAHLAPLAAILVAAYLPLIYWSVAGFETTLLAVLVTSAWIDIVQGRPPSRPILLLTTATVTRPDAILFLVLAVLGYLLARKTSGLLPALGLSLAVIACAEALRLVYYGEVLPNTYYLKTQLEPGFGLRYVRLFMLYGGGFLAVLLFGASLFARSREGLLIAGAFALVALYTVAIGGDAFHYGRFFVPIMPAVITATVVISLTFIRSNRLTSGLSRRLTLASTGSCCLLLVVLLGNVWVVREVGRYLVHGTYRNWWVDEQNAEIGLYLQQNAPGAKIGVFYAGTIPYVTMSPAVDFLGKSDPVVARQKAVQGKVPGHNKFDFAYSLSIHQPDVIVMHLSLDELRDTQQLEAITRGHFPYRALVLKDDTFRSHYAANRLEADLLWVLFLWDGSALLDVLPVTAEPP